MQLNPFFWRWKESKQASQASRGIHFDRPGCHDSNGKQAIWIFVNEPQPATTKKGTHRSKFEIECDARMHGEIHMALAKIVELYIPTVATFRLAWCRRAVTILSMVQACCHDS
jgi:hypothetical protein